MFTKLISLIKIKITLLSTMSAVTGYIMASKGFSFQILVFIPALFVLASGAAGLNQIQESNLDKLMERTRNRPLPAGDLSLFGAVVFVILLIIAGLAILYFQFGILPASLGATTVILYNGMYTYLKRVSAFASIPGAFIGVLPPVIGWISAGGKVLTIEILGIAVFFYLWQIPHFWLLAGVNHLDYARAGFPQLTGVFSFRQLDRILFTWLSATACSALMLPLFKVVEHFLSMIGLFLLVIWILFSSSSLIRRNRSNGSCHRQIFKKINIFAALVMVLLMVDQGILI